MENKKIIKRKYYALAIRLDSPLNVSSGDHYYTDSDVIKNKSGELFVPGTSLAGAFRNRLNQKKTEEGIMGYSKGSDGNMSSLFISDLYFRTDKNSLRSSVRDGVNLSDEKIVDNKFDMEIIETGAEGILYFHYILRKDDSEQRFDQSINIILQEIQNGAIRIGSNKNRGFGRIHIEQIYQSEFTKDDIDDWLSFVPDYKNLSNYQTIKTYEEWEKEQKRVTSSYIKITVPLKLTGGISIRKYSTEPGKADFEQITCNGDAVIPGSSWMGAIRADAKNILDELGVRGKDDYIDQWFGYIDKEKKKAKQSTVVVAENVIKQSHSQLMTRNRINRFDAGTKSGALYTEIAYFNGNTNLELMVKKDEEGKYYALIGLLQLIIFDIQKGYVPVGGQTAVGRGIFEADNSREIEYSEPISLKECNQALYEQLFKSNAI